jgi:2-dehydropantoate 2-reductase
LVGPGAVGCTLLAHLARTNRYALTVAARTPFRTLEVETLEETLRFEPRIVTGPAQISGHVDWVLLATKTYDVDSALPWLERLAGPQTRIAILQNGVEHLERLPARYAREGLVPVVIDCPAERSAPGRVRQRGVALATVPDTAAGRACVTLFAGTPVQVRTTDDWKTVAWRKLCLNAAGAVSAATLQPAGIVHFEPIADVMRGIVREVVQVGRAEGAQLDGAMVETVIENARRAPRDGVNSIQADRAAGRRMEIDARNGVIVRLGRKHGIPTPYNETLAALLHAVSVSAT